MHVLCVVFWTTVSKIVRPFWLPRRKHKRCFDVHHQPISKLASAPSVDALHNLQLFVWIRSLLYPYSHIFSSVSVISEEAVFGHGDFGSGSRGGHYDSQSASTGFTFATRLEKDISGVGRRGVTHLCLRFRV